jgi:dTDP-4-amino-4,6-dideoxygalactose transaminase
LVQGTCVKEFEAALRDYLNTKHAIIVSSGTAALHLSLMALGIKTGDEIIVPAFTYPATANVVELVGAKSVLVDITSDDFCIDASKIEESINSKTKAIVPVHEFGQSAEMDKILTVAEKYNLAIIEDAACALGTEFNDKKVGTFGKLGCFSFHPRKAITTGEGGAVVTNDDDLAERIRSLRNHGISVKNGKNDFVYAGLNYRMTDFQAALGIPQLSGIENIINTRIEMAGRYDERLSEIDWIKTPTKLKNRKNIYQTYHIVVDDTINRDKLIHSVKDAGIETTLGAQALNCLTYYKEKYGLKAQNFPNATKAFKQGVALPLHLEMSGDDIRFVVETLKRTKVNA